jgi:hypothetical protein
VAAKSTVTVVGVKETLRELNKMEPELAKQIKKDVKQITASVVADAKSAVPGTVISGFSRNWQGGRLTPFSSEQVRKSITTRFSNRKRSAMAVFAVVMKSPIGEVFDMAGRSSANNLATRLETRFGRASRVMWPAYERNQGQVERDLQKVVDVIQREANSRLVK